MHQHNN